MISRFNSVNPVSSDLNTEPHAALDGTVPVREVFMPLSARSLDDQGTPASRLAFDCSPFRAGLHDSSGAALLFSKTIEERKPGFLRNLATPRIVSAGTGYSEPKPSIPLLDRVLTATQIRVVEKAQALPPQNYVGICRNCGCTAADPCHLPSGDECSWLTPEADLCSAKPCALLLPRPNR